MVAFSDMEHVILEENCWSGLFLAYWVKRMTRAQFAIMSQRKTQTNAESFTLTAKLNAVFWACVQNEVTGIHKFYRREIWFIERIYASFSYELRARISLNWFKLQGCEKPEVTFFCVWPLWILSEVVRYCFKKIARKTQDSAKKVVNISKYPWIF